LFHSKHGKECLISMSCYKGRPKTIEKDFPHIVETNRAARRIRQAT